ncbi:transcriptional regulator with XRE-family HTH domain [Amycolatopsis bartoniae]|uniref:HTH cro/C1-type domain-containing protein n=1 Tax=Amycolatopsis bartoniae TaxID=941986 RepID=A0A8H9J4M0_9PSEU|nr:helix-turn-helix domain-containing protein [Amycolatopsis bartoniae]MBB2935070.1 transcriptional regulator with XRE-family HTH domain [Amycolatopsis bartoniae]TVT02547.1 helix-turn-helix domain-containing protein [Amycolatopsis bartoniae]GHF74120.1 hypothetical protein GCM10017566_54860 [Amycolatopsis bartoniae]
MTWSRDAIKRLYVEVGIRVRNARKQAEWSQTGLGDAIGLTRSSVANIEAGRQHAPAHVIVLIAQTLKLPYDELLPSGEELNEIARASAPDFDLSELSETSQEFVTATIRRAMGEVGGE